MDLKLSAFRLRLSVRLSISITNHVKRISQDSRGGGSVSQLFKGYSRVYVNLWYPVDRQRYGLRPALGPENKEEYACYFSNIHQ